MHALEEIVGNAPFQLGYIVPEIGDAGSFMHALGGSIFERFDDARIHSQTYRGAGCIN